MPVFLQFALPFARLYSGMVCAAIVCAIRLAPEGRILNTPVREVGGGLQQTGTVAARALRVAAQLSNRKKELLRRRVHDCDFLSGNIRFPDTKNGETRTVPMTSSVRGLLQMPCTGKKPDGYVFTWPNGSQVRNHRNAWAAACVAAGEGRYLCRKCEEPWADDKCSSATPTRSESGVTKG